MLGFACICKSLGKEGSFRAATIKNISTLDEEAKLKKLKSIAVDNLFNTFKIIKWCISNNILLYRLSSDLIPLATYYMDWHWWEDEAILKQCSRIKEAAANSMRLSMHPDQFCVLNSDKDEVVKKSIDILEYHNKLSNLVGNKLLILHVGSTAGGKAVGLQRFEENFLQLNEDIKSKLAIENDDKSYTASEVLSLCEKLRIPMILDLHHYRCNNQGEDLFALKERIINTWQGHKPKLHLSSGKEFPTDRRHSDFIDVKDYNACLGFSGDAFDIMLECKEKDKALLELIKLNEKKL